MSEDILSIQWKRRPSELKGYQKTLYHTDEDGNYFRVDYDLNQKRVRLYYEDNKNGGIQYYSVITDGEITSEKNLTTGRSSSLADKFSRLAPVFSTIGNRQVLKIIGSNYEIGDFLNRQKARRARIETTKKRYFKPEDEKGGGISLSSFGISKKIGFVDIADILVSAVLVYGTYYLTSDYVLTGIVSAICGVVAGFTDIFLRRREPLFIKILFFVIAGAAMYVYGYYIQ